MAVSSVLDSIREHSTSERDKGDRFERVVQEALRIDRTYRERFTDVWLWMEWPGRGNEPDTGIDLVAKNRDGGYTAIQCKLYAADHQLVKADIDSFFTASGRDPFTDRIIVATTDLWSQNAERSLIGQQIPVTRIGIDDLDAMTIDWSRYDAHRLTALVATEKKRLRVHQEIAVDKVRAGFGESDRGKLIMACGTGKTFTSLRIAEEHAGAGKAVLFLAPSIALVSQSLKEWTAEANLPIRPFAVCSDPTVGKPIAGENASAYDLPIPPTTDVRSLIDAGFADLPEDEMTVVFSTYQSIQVVADMLTATQATFDLVVSDEAHRTTGMTGSEEEASAFVKVHDDGLIPANKRLYMTATPRIYKPAAKEDAAEQDAVLASMDDEATYGKEFHRLGFGESVERGLLADYKVLILSVEEDAVSESFQSLLSQDGDLKLPDVAKFIGCLSGLAKLPSSSGKGGFDGEEPAMQRAVAFWSSIKESERFAAQFDLVADHYNRQRAVEADPRVSTTRQLSVPTRHVDGTTKISSRRSDIRWLKETPPEGECRVLTNAKCLTEGVDVPALDAVMFLKPKRSKIDIVQAVGRVMRKPPGKSTGYIILPIAIPAGQDVATALDKNTDYDVVWDVLQALRSHDERFNAYINRLALSSQEPGDDAEGHIEIIDATPVADDETEDTGQQGDDAGVQSALFTFEDWTDAIYTKIVKKVGTRTYWEDWARDVAVIAGRHSSRIRSILKNNADVAETFALFLDGIRANLNDSIGEDAAISMLSQHLITRPIFETLFGSDSFVMGNPVSLAMQDMVDVLDDHNLDTETESLDTFYDSVRRRVEGIPPSDARARQQIIKDLYGNFFSIAFPTVAESLGIVYTPVEVVDFILRASEAALREHFDASLTDEGVHILDPFTGTGTFVTRLLQTGLIDPDDLSRKYEEEIHANEILLLAYYIAAVNIESTHQQQLAIDGSSRHPTPFPGIVLTDTFQLGEAGEGSGALDVFPINNERASRQKALDIRVIVGNPPYSAGQASANDNNPNRPYPALDASIAATYAERSTATNKNSLYDSYIRAIRWASNRVVETEDGGIVAFVTNGGYIDSNTADGLRLTLQDEFHHIYIYNLRGNQRTSGEQSRKEGGKIFGSGSRATIAVMLLVKQTGPVPNAGAVLSYRDIGDYLSREQKLAALDQDLRQSSVKGEPHLNMINWEHIEPNEHGDWINQRSESFITHMAAQANDELSVFRLRTNGLKSNRDAWNYNASLSKLQQNVERMIAHYNAQVNLFAEVHPGAKGSQVERASLAKKTVDLNPLGFSWDAADFQRLTKGEQYELDDALYMTAVYRPFYKRKANFGRKLNVRVYQLPKVYPDAEAKNLSICVRGLGFEQPFSVLATNRLPDVQLLGNAMNYPLYLYEEDHGADVGGLFDHQQLGNEGVDSATRKHNVTDEALAIYRHLDDTIEKDDIFFYVYGILHSPDYRSGFKADLKKSLPRIPQVSSSEDFWTFTQAGRELVDLHTAYEDVAVWPDLDITFGTAYDADDPNAYRVQKMRYLKAVDPDDSDGRKVDDKTTIIYNSDITISGIPERAHAYRLGARSAIDWVIESYRVRTHTASGIVNDPNDWATEHGQPTYILDLVGRVVTVSMRTLEIVENLPKLSL